MLRGGKLQHSRDQHPALPKNIGDEVTLLASPDKNPLLDLPYL